MEEKVQEIRTVKVSNLSDYAQKEVADKVIKMSAEEQAQYIGYANVHIYSSEKGLYTKFVEPIKGTCIDEFRRMSKEIDWDGIF